MHSTMMNKIRNWSCWCTLCSWLNQFLYSHLWICLSFGPKIDHFFHYILTTSCLLDIEYIWCHLFYLKKTQRQNIDMPTSSFPRSHKHFLSICWWDCLCKLVLENAVALGTVNQTSCCFYCDVYRVLIFDYQLKINIYFFSMQ